MHALKQVFVPAEPPPPTAQPEPVSEALAQAAAANGEAAPIAAAAAPRPVPSGLSLLRSARANALGMLLWVVSLSLLLGFWYVATKYRLEFYIRFTNIPTPAEVLQKLVEVNQSSKFLTNIGMSVRRILIGFGIAMAIAIPLGLLIGRYRPIRDLLLPICEVLRPIPAIAWVPMSIMLWPNNEASIVYITFLGSFFPILLNTIHGVQSIDSVLIRAAQCLGAKEPALLWNVVLPGAMPHIFTGLAVGMGVAWVSLIAAEMISGQFGVGYFTWEAYSLVNYAEIVLGMITIGVLGLICSGAIRAGSRLAMPWLKFSNIGKR
jgi:NitT/TauT family transport system permease protein